MSLMMGCAGSTDIHNASNLHPGDNLLADITCLLHSRCTIRPLNAHQTLMHPLTVLLSLHTTLLKMKFNEKVLSSSMCNDTQIVMNLKLLFNGMSAVAI